MSIPSLLLGVLAIADTVTNIAQADREATQLKKENNLLAQQQIQQVDRLQTQSLSETYSQAVLSGLSLSSNSILSQIKNIADTSKRAADEIETQRQQVNKSLSKNRSSGNMLINALESTATNIVKNQETNNLYKSAEYYFSKQLEDETKNIL